MKERYAFQWSSNIGDWAGYWTDLDYFEASWNELEYEEKTSDGLNEEELHALQEDTQIVEPPEFIEYLVKFNF